MAGEIEEPIRLNSLENSLHSGSISFGRFETEILCWERRSSFSHNRYLEEVEKCSKPGLVTEKKAYFEAHFRKKGFPGQKPSECQNGGESQTGESDVSDNVDYDQDIDHMNEAAASACFYEIPDDSVQGKEHEGAELEEDYGTMSSESKNESASDNTNHVDCTPGYEHVEERHTENRNLLLVNSEPEIEIKGSVNDGESIVHKDHEVTVGDELSLDNAAVKKNNPPTSENRRVQSVKERIASNTEHVKPRLNSSVIGLAQGKRNISTKASKSTESKSGKRVHSIPVRSKVEKKMQEAAAQNGGPMQKTSKPKVVDDVIKRTNKEPRSGGTVATQPSTSQKTTSSVHQNANRLKQPVPSPKAGMKQSGPGFGSRSVSYSERRKEEKSQAEIQSLRKNLNFKATPLPAFYRGVGFGSDKNKAVAGNTKPGKLQFESSGPGIKVPEQSPSISETGNNQTFSREYAVNTMDQTQASGGGSCHSTVTSDSNPSSPAAETSNTHPRQPRLNNLLRATMEQEKEKNKNVQRPKVNEGNKAVKGRKMNAGQGRVVHADKKAGTVRKS